MDKFMELISNIATTTLWNIAGVLIVCIIVYGLYKYNKQLLMTLAYRFVVVAEEQFNSKEGQAKFKYVMENIRMSLPFILRIFWSEKFVANIIEDSLEACQNYFRSQKEFQLQVCDKILSDITKAAPTSAKNFDIQLKQTIDKTKMEIDQKGFVEGFAEVNTNLKDNTEIRAGIKAGIKF